jgi:hypothetical protein
LAKLQEMVEAHHTSHFSVLDEAETASVVFLVNLNANAIGKSDITPSTLAFQGHHLAEQPEVFEDIRTKSWITHRLKNPWFCFANGRSH